MSSLATLENRAKTLTEVKREGTFSFLTLFDHCLLGNLLQPTSLLTSHFNTPHFTSCPRNETVDGLGKRTLLEFFDLNLIQIGRYVTRLFFTT